MAEPRAEDEEQADLASTDVEQAANHAEQIARETIGPWPES